MNNLNNQNFKDVDNQPRRRLIKIKNKLKKNLKLGGGEGDDNNPPQRPPRPVGFLQALQKNRKDEKSFDFEKNIEEKKQKLKEEKQNLNKWAEEIILQGDSKEKLISYKIQIDNYKKKIEKLEKDVERYQKSYLETNKKLLDCMSTAVTTVDTKPQSLDDLKKQHQEIQNILFKGLFKGTQSVGLNEKELTQEFERLSKLIQNHPDHKEKTWKDENYDENNTALSKIQRFIPSSEKLQSDFTEKNLYELIKRKLNKIKDGKEECKKDESNLNIEDVAEKLSIRIFKLKWFFIYLGYDSIRLGKVEGVDLFNYIKLDVLSVLETRAIYAALHDVSDKKRIIRNITKGEWVKTLENKVEYELDPKTQASLIEVDKLYDDLESFCKSYCAEGLFEVEKKKQTYQKPIIGSQTNPVQQRMMELKKLREQLKKGKEATQKLSNDAARKCNWWEKCELDTQSGGEKLSNDKSNKMFYIVQDI